MRFLPRRADLPASARSTSRHVREAPSDVPLVHRRRPGDGDPGVRRRPARPPVQPADTGVVGAVTEKPPSFVNDVVPILTRRAATRVVPRQGGRAERLPPVAARLRPGHGPPLDHARVRRPADRPARRRRACCSASRPATSRTRAASSSTGRAASTRCCSTGSRPVPPARRTTTRSWSSSNCARPADHEGRRTGAAPGRRRVHRRHAARRDLADASSTPTTPASPRSTPTARRRCCATARRPSGPVPGQVAVVVRDRPVRPARSSRHRLTARTTSSTSTSSPSSPPCASSRRTCAATRSSSAAPSSTRSACCRRRTRCGRSSPTSGPTSGRG